MATADNCKGADDARFKALVDNAPLGVYLVDADFRIREVNPVALPVFGDVPGGVVGRDFEEIIRILWHKEYADEVVRIFRRTLETGEPFVTKERAEHRVDRAAVEYYDWRIDRLTLPDGRYGVVCYFRDVSEQVRARLAVAEGRDAIERQRRLYEAILSNTPDLAYIFGLDHRFIYANEVLLRMWGKTWEEAIGKTCLELGYEPWHAEMHDREIEQVVATKQPIRGQVPFAGTFGRRIYDYIFVPVLNSRGEVEAVAGTTRDITELKEAEDALKEADRRKDEFMAMLAHELRNPLAGITMSAELLARLKLEDERARFAVPAIARQTRQLQRLADDLLDVARATYGKLTLTKAPVELLALAKQAGAQFAQKAEVTGSETWVDADAARVQQMIENLLDNAIKYGGRVVRVRAWPEAGRGCVAVEDDGPGIEPRLLPDLVKPFVQGAQSLDRKQGGLGLGLALVNLLASQHGGELRAHSEGPGKGSTFTITLPAAAKPAANEERAQSARGGRKRRVLVIEDEADTGESLRLLLEAEGHEVALARNGVEGLAALRAFRPDVALVDIGLPGLNGLELARQVRSLPGAEAVKLIAVTGYGQEKDRNLSRDAGFDQHFTKPVAYDDLARAFES